MSRLKGKVCDICERKIDEKGVMSFLFFPTRKFYKYKYVSRLDKTIKYPKDMCEKCFNKFIKFCMQEREEHDEEE